MKIFSRILIGAVTLFGIGSIGLIAAMGAVLALEDGGYLERRTPWCENIPLCATLAATPVVNDANPYKRHNKEYIFVMIVGMVETVMSDIQLYSGFRSKLIFTPVCSELKLAVEALGFKPHIPMQPGVVDQILEACVASQGERDKLKAERERLLKVK